MKTLKFLFPNEEDEVDDSIFEMDIVEGDIRVITLSGVLETFEYQPQKKICHLKGEIENKFKTPPDKQRLLYNDQELKVFLQPIYIKGKNQKTNANGVTDYQPHMAKEMTDIEYAQIEYTKN